MEYKNIYDLADTYPDIAKYSSKRVKNMRLTGKYVELNYIDFDIPTVEDIIVVPGTTFRFLLIVKDSLADSEPKYFMSDTFYNDTNLIANAIYNYSITPLNSDNYSGTPFNTGNIYTFPEIIDASLNTITSNSIKINIFYTC